MAGSEEAPARRIRGKSSVRGRSPNPKSLKKAAKDARENRGKSKKVAEVSPGLVTPPPKSRNNPGDVSGSSASKDLRRKISFSKDDTTLVIEPENPRPNKDMKLKEAEEIWKSMTKDPISICVIFESIHSIRHKSYNISHTFTIWQDRERPKAAEKKGDQEWELIRCGRWDWGQEKVVVSICKTRGVPKGKRTS